MEFAVLVPPIGFFGLSGEFRDCAVGRVHRFARGQNISKIRRRFRGERVAELLMGRSQIHCETGRQLVDLQYSLALCPAKGFISCFVRFYATLISGESYA
jgi:hypothetical protein